MKVYLAAPYALRDELRRDAEVLRLHGHICTSSWLFEQKPITPATVGNATADPDEEARRHVEQDMDDVFNSDALVVVTWQQAGLMDDRAVAYVNSGGRHVETGLALAWQKPVLVWGPDTENIFHRGRGVTLCPTWHDVLRTLDALQTPAQRHG